MDSHEDLNLLVVVHNQACFNDNSLTTDFRLFYLLVQDEILQYTGGVRKGKGIYTFRHV